MTAAKVSWNPEQYLKFETTGSVRQWTCWAGSIWNRPDWFMTWAVGPAIPPNCWRTDGLIPESSESILLQRCWKKPGKVMRIWNSSRRTWKAGTPNKKRTSSIRMPPSTGSATMKAFSHDC